MKSILLSVAIIFIVAIIISVFGFCESRIEKYRVYYQTTETLLDSLEDQFNWIDRYDSEAIDNYYNARNAL